jgi:putative flippase GtrA
VIRHPITARAMRYGVAGLFATAVYIGGVWCFVELVGLAAVPASIAATVVVIVTSYLVNRRWVFDTTRSHTSAFTRFVAASGLSFALNAGLMHLAVAVLGWPYLAGAALTAVVVPPINFVINYFWAFARHTDP